MKIKFNSDEYLTLEKTLELYNMIIVASFVSMKATNTIYKFS